MHILFEIRCHQFFPLGYFIRKRIAESYFNTKPCWFIHENQKAFFHTKRNWNNYLEIQINKTCFLKCFSGSSDAILCLVNAQAKVEATDNDGLTALHCAASRGHHDCIDTLIGLCGAEVDVRDQNGSSPLFYAVTLGHAECTSQVY